MHLSKHLFHRGNGDGVFHLQVVADDDEFSATRRDDLLLRETSAATLDQVQVFIDLVSTINSNIDLHNDTGYVFIYPYAISTRLPFSAWQTTQEHTGPKFQVEGYVHHQPFFVSELID